MNASTRPLDPPASGPFALLSGGQADHREAAPVVQCPRRVASIGAIGDSMDGTPRRSAGDLNSMLELYENAVMGDSIGQSTGSVLHMPGNNTYTSHGSPTAFVVGSGGSVPAFDEAASNLVSAVGTSVHQPTTPSNASRSTTATTTTTTANVTTATAAPRRPARQQQLQTAPSAVQDSAASNASSDDTTASSPTKNDSTAATPLAPVDRALQDALATLPGACFFASTALPEMVLAQRAARGVTGEVPFVAGSVAKQVFIGQLPAFAPRDVVLAALDHLAHFYDVPRLLHYREAVSEAQTAHALLTVESASVPTVLSLNRRIFFTRSFVYVMEHPKQTPQFQRAVSKALAGLPDAAKKGVLRACIVIEPANKCTSRSESRASNDTPSGRGTPAHNRRTRGSSHQQQQQAFTGGSAPRHSGTGFGMPQQPHNHHQQQQAPPPAYSAPAPAGHPSTPVQMHPSSPVNNAPLMPQTVRLSSAPPQQQQSIPVMATQHQQQPAEGHGGSPSTNVAFMPYVPPGYVLMPINALSTTGNSGPSGSSSSPQPVVQGTVYTSQPVGSPASPIDSSLPMFVSSGAPSPVC